MAQVVRLLPLTAKGWVQSHSSPRGECGGERGTWKGFPRSISVLYSQ